LDPTVAAGFLTGADFFCCFELSAFFLSVGFLAISFLASFLGAGFSAFLGASLIAGFA